MIKLIKCATTSLLLLCTVSITFANAADNPANCQPELTAGGSLSYLSVLDANAPMPCMDIGWWYFVGLMQDQQNNQHSLQVNLFRKSLGGYGPAGAGSIGFTYNDNGQNYYLWSSFPNDILTTLGQFKATTTTKQNLDIDVSTKSMHYHFYHDSKDTAHSVGQVGARYILVAQGKARVGVTQLQPLDGHIVAFNTTLNLEDQRGLLPEGQNGYIGTKDVKSSWEFGAPNLSVKQWSMTIIDSHRSSRLPLHFSGSTSQNNRIWYDRQVLYKKQSQLTHSQMISGDTLYRGTWMSFCLNQSPLQNYCGVAVAFWQNGVATSDMDTDKNAIGGFLNIYTPTTDGNSGNQLNDIIPTNSTNGFQGYRIQNDPNATFHSALSANVYDRSVYLTINPSSSAGAVMNAQRHSTTPLRLKLTTISPLTENVMYTVSNAFYEGAANIYLCDANNNCNTPLGTGFVEQMGYGE
ncbi:MAG: lipocalin-like domain-containing protein [Coxiellaceae bacterium]|nr:lipocalin-like domain-containing protein [Coxiellaceae bacterium]